MSVFAVLLQDPTAAEKLGNLIEQTYPEPDHININDMAWLISGDLLINDIADNLHLRAPDEDEGEYSIGIVLRLNGTYTGLSYSPTWDWLARSTAQS